MRFLVGTYAYPPVPGIYLVNLDEHRSTARIATSCAELPCPSFLSRPATGNFFFAVSEIGQAPGSVATLHLAPEGINLGKSIPSFGTSPCHINYIANHELVVVCNYDEGNVVCYRVNQADGSLSPRQTITHFGAGLHPIRQKSPHPHSSLYDAQHEILLVADLGCDFIYQYTFHEDFLRLSARTPVTPGSGPRHMVSHPNGCIYLACELTNTVCTLKFQQDRYCVVQSITTLPSTYNGQSSVADIHLAPDGRSVYVSNRGHDSITQLKIAADGHLGFVDSYPTHGRTPRNFAIAPDGKSLLVANQDSNNVSLFSIASDSGSLEYQATVLEAEKPAFVMFQAETPN